MKSVISEQKALKDFDDISNQLVRLFAKKNTEHGNSFFRGDLRDLYFNLKRKWHRVETKLMDGDARNVFQIRGSNMDSLIEDLRDLSSFSIMGVVMAKCQEECGEESVE